MMRKGKRVAILGMICILLILLIMGSVSSCGTTERSQGYWNSQETSDAHDWGISFDDDDPDPDPEPTCTPIPWEED
jgi:hypothetical protein